VTAADLVEFVQGVQMDNATDTKNFHVCSQCGYSTTVKQNLFKHVKVVHLKIRTPKNFECERCPFRAEYKSLIKHHMETVHDGVREFACSFCDYKVSRSGLTKYRLTSTNAISPNVKFALTLLENWTESLLLKRLSESEFSRSDVFEGMNPSRSGRSTFK